MSVYRAALIAVQLCLFMSPHPTSLLPPLTRSRPPPFPSPPTANCTSKCPCPCCVYLTALFHMSKNKKCPNAGCLDPHGIKTPHTKATCALVYDKRFNKFCSTLPLKEQLEWVGRQSQRSGGGKAWKSARLSSLRDALEEQDLDASDDTSNASNTVGVKLEPGLSTDAATAEGGRGDSDTDSENVSNATRSASPCCVCVVWRLIPTLLLLRGRVLYPPAMPTPARVVWPFAVGSRMPPPPPLSASFVILSTSASSVLTYFVRPAPSPCPAHSPIRSTPLLP